MNYITSIEEKNRLLETLKARFEKNMNRHLGLTWAKVAERLRNNPHKLWSLNELEKTGGEPDVIGIDSKTGAFEFYDCAKETPLERRSVCYDQEALVSRKEFKPLTSAMAMALEMDAEILSESEYRHLQELEAFDTKTSSWILTPKNIRELGGALFCDRRYNTVFVYHNEADSYYKVRGFRAKVVV